MSVPPYKSAYSRLPNDVKRSPISGRFVSKGGVDRPGRRSRKPRQRITIICEHCNREAPAYRITKRYCGEVCRKAAQNDRRAGSLGMEGLSGDNLRMFHYLEERKPDMAELCRGFYAWHGKEATESMLHILCQLSQRAQQPPEPARRSVLARLGGRP